jgi:hypothetical protein
MPFTAPSQIYHASVIERSYGPSRPDDLSEPDGEKMPVPVFPSALVACIADGRSPSVKELAAMTRRVWHEVYRGKGGDGDYYRSAAIARAALLGTDSRSSAMG